MCDHVEISRRNISISCQTRNGIYFDILKNPKTYKITDVFNFSFNFEDIELIGL